MMNEYPCKFYCRKTGRLKFKIDPKIESAQKFQKRSCLFVFHPSDPLVISMQVGVGSGIVNIHSRT